MAPVITLAIAAASTSVLALLSPEAHGWLVILLTGAILALSVFPAVRWFLGSRRAVPAFEAICLGHAAFFGLTGLLLRNQYLAHFTDAGRLVPFREVELEAALGAIAVGLLALEVAYYAFMAVPLANALPVVDLRLSASRLRTYLGAAVIGGVFVTEARAIGVTPSSDSPLGAIVGVLANQVTVAAAILAYLVFASKRRQPAYEVLLLVAAGGAVVVGISSSLVETAFVIPFVISIIALQLRREQVIVVLVAMGLAYLLFIQPVKLRYRRMLSQQDYALSFVQRIALWYDAVASFVEPPDPNLSSAFASEQIPPNDARAVETARSSLARFDYVHQFELMRLYTPDVIPYYEGTSYTYFAIGWVPRLIWPDKPSALEGNNRMVIDYGVLSDKSQLTTTAGLGLIPEAFANFGDIGIVVVMAIQGIVLAAVTRIFTAGGSIGANAALVSVLVFMINGVGGITSVMYGGLLQNLVANTLLLWLAAGRPIEISQAFSRLLSRKSAHRGPQPA